MSAFVLLNKQIFVSRKQKLRVASSEENFKDMLILFTDNITNMLTIQNSEIKEEISEIKEEISETKDELKNIVDTYGIKWEQASDTYEIMARTQIRKRFIILKRAHFRFNCN